MKKLDGITLLKFRKVLPFFWHHGLLLSLLFSLCFLHANAKAPTELLIKANTAYQEEKYKEAIDSYETILAQGYQSKALYYNLGNSYFKRGNKAKAVLNLERAQLLAPKDKMIKDNLSFVKSQLSDEIIPLQVFPLIRFWRNLRNSASANAWALLSLLFFGMGIAGLIFWVLGSSRKRKKQGFFLGLIALAISIIPISLAYGKKQSDKHPRIAVVMKEEVPLLSAPNSGSEKLYTLFEGASVEKIETLQDWHQVRLANGYRGWVQGDVISLLW